MSNETQEGEYLPAEAEDAPEEAPSLDSETLLNFTQNIRHQLATNFVKDGMPDDKESQQMLLATLRDMDQTSINRIKADIDSQALESNRKIQEIVDRLHDTMPTGLRAGQATDHHPQVSAEELPAFDQQDGELSLGVEQETSDQFLGRMEGSGDE